MRPALGLERPQGGSPLENRHENGPRHARSLAVPVPVRGTVFDSKLIINYDSIYTTINRNTTVDTRRSPALVADDGRHRFRTLNLYSSSKNKISHIVTTTRVSLLNAKMSSMPARTRVQAQNAASISPITFVSVSRPRCGKRGGCLCRWMPCITPSRGRGRSRAHRTRSEQPAASRSPLVIRRVRRVRRLHN